MWEDEEVDKKTDEKIEEEVRDQGGAPHHVVVDSCGGEPHAWPKERIIPKR